MMISQSICKQSEEGAEDLIKNKPGLQVQVYFGVFHAAIHV